MEVVAVNANGQITLPAKERRKYGFKPGTKIGVVATKGGLLLQKARVVNEHVFERIARIADEKKLTQADVIRLCREVRHEIYAEEYG